MEKKIERIASKSEVFFRAGKPIGNFGFIGTMDGLGCHRSLGNPAAGLQMNLMKNLFYRQHNGEMSLESRFSVPDYCGL